MLGAAEREDDRMAEEEGQAQLFIFSVRGCKDIQCKPNASKVSQVNQGRIHEIQNRINISLEPCKHSL